METTKKRLRINFAPLDIASSIVCITPNSPVTQVYNNTNSQYEPDRTLTPTVILPRIVAYAGDGSWPDPEANHVLADMHWYADGKEISTVAAWTGKYEIEQNGSMRGALTIKRNVPPDVQVSLVFKAVVADTRTGVNYPVETDPIVLFTSVKSEDTYSVAIGDAQGILYNPFKDRLHIYNYKVANGIIAGSTALKNEATDENAHIRSIPVTVYRGEDVVTTGFTVSYYRVTKGTLALTALTTGGEVVSMSNSQITLDLRLIDTGDYMVQVSANGKVAAQIQFSVKREYQAYQITCMNDLPIAPRDTMRYDEAMVRSDGNVVECPEAILRMIWMSDTNAKKGVTHNEGRKTLFSLAEAGLGSDHNNDWLDVYITAGLHPSFSMAVDASGNQFTDESGSALIFN